MKQLALDVGGEGGGEPAVKLTQEAAEKIVTLLARCLLAIVEPVREEDQKGGGDDRRADAS